MALLNVGNRTPSLPHVEDLGLADLDDLPTFCVIPENAKRLSGIQIFHDSQLPDLVVEVSEGAAKLLATPRIGGRIEVILHASSGEKQRIPLASIFSLLGRQRCPVFSGGLRLKIRNLIFYGLAFPPSRHVLIVPGAGEFNYEHPSPQRYGQRHGRPSEELVRCCSRASTYGA
jgi:hypothetical protein